MKSPSALIVVAVATWCPPLVSGIMVVPAIEFATASIRFGTSVAWAPVEKAELTTKSTNARGKRAAGLQAQIVPRENQRRAQSIETDNPQNDPAYGCLNAQQLIFRWDTDAKPVTYAGANMGIRITFAFFANVLQSFAFARELLIGVLVDILLRILTLSNSGKEFVA